MGLDATRKLPGEGYHRTWPELVTLPDAIRAKVDAMRATLPSKTL
jgi:4-hydroxy-3-polyprenylbenzoate decarboxylase